MPLIKSAKKQLKQSKKRKAKNDFYKSVYRDFRKKFETAIKNKDLDEAKKVFFNEKSESGVNLRSWLQSIIDKLAKKGIIHKNNASRKKSNFVRMIKSIS